MKRRRVAQDTRVFSDVISNGLYIVFEWIAQRRREAIEQLRQRLAPAGMTRAGNYSARAGIPPQSSW